MLQQEVERDPAGEALGMLKIAITGASGTIGRPLAADLARDHEPLNGRPTRG